MLYIASALYYAPYTPYIVLDVDLLIDEENFPRYKLGPCARSTQVLTNSRRNYPGLQRCANGLSWVSSGNWYMLRVCGLIRQLYMMLKHTYTTIRHKYECRLSYNNLLSNPEIILDWIKQRAHNITEILSYKSKKG